MTLKKKYEGDSSQATSLLFLADAALSRIIKDWEGWLGILPYSHQIAIALRLHTWNKLQFFSILIPDESWKTSGMLHELGDLIKHS